MIEGSVDADGLPRVVLTGAGRGRPALIDTGFNGDLEHALGPAAEAQYEGTFYSVVADGRRIFEESYRVVFRFDGELVPAAATFAAVNELLIGTRLLRRHMLNIDCERGTVRIQRSEGG